MRYVHVFRETEMLKSQRICKVFWFWVKGNFLYILNWTKTWWQFQTNIFYLWKCGRFVSFVLSILSLWAFCFNILQGRHAQLPQKSCCKSHSYLGTFIDAQWNFYFWERWRFKTGRASRYLCCGISLQHLCFWTPPFKLSLKRLSSHMFRNRLFCTGSDKYLYCFNSTQVFQKAF